MKHLIFIIFVLCSDLLFGQSTIGELRIVVQNSKRSSPIKTARVALFHPNNKVDTLAVDSNGVAIARVEMGSQIELIAMADDHYDSKRNILKMDSIFKRVVLDCSEMNIHYVLQLPVFYFKKNSTELTPESYLVLDSFITNFLDKPTRSFVIELNGNTRMMKSFEQSFHLALNRANHIKELILQKLPYKHTIIASSYACSRLVNYCERIKCSEEEILMNDRVTLKLLRRFN